jgi:hypothetical protein
MALCAALSGPVLAAAAPPPLTAAQVSDWREDLHFLATELPRRHPMLFDGLTPTRLTRAQLDSAVADLDARIPTLARHEVTVGLQRIVAMVGAGHTSINPMFDRSLGYRSYPLELYAFRDGIFVVRADSAHRELVGARVLRIGSLPVDSALARVATVISHENQQFVRSAGMVYLMIPEVLHALRIAPELERLDVTLDQNGRRTVTLTPVGPLPLRSHEGPVDERAGWPTMRPASVPPPLWLSRPERRWLEYLPERRTLYVSFQSHVPSHQGEPIDAFVARVLASADSLRPARLVIDVRDDLGGDSSYNLALVQGIIRRVWIDQPDRLFVIIGRGTYSAAMSLVNEMERYTQATFVGEPTGSPPAFFGDHVSVSLPHSGIQLNISTLWWETQNPRDHRSWVAPAVYAEASSADYRAGVDPALQAVFEQGTRPRLEARLAETFASDDTVRALRVVVAERDQPENRYANIEAKVNAIGYEQLKSGHAERAARVLAVNARAFPGSANAYDSLGEAFERLGRRDDAVASYRRALAIAPDLPSSREALRRLGVSP